MIFAETQLSGVVVVELEKLDDDRGFFARSFCADEFAAHGLMTECAQANVSVNHRRGTLRGMHYQAEPGPEGKLVRCTIGAIHDVAVDLRPDSPTFRRWTACELSAENRRALHIPPGCAHGFLSLTDASEVLYLMSSRFEPALARGVRWDDPAFAIDWPAEPIVMSEKDANIPDFSW